MQERVEECEGRAGDLHMQLLLPFVPSLDFTSADACYAVSASSRTALSKAARFLVAQDNVLRGCMHLLAHLHIRRFASGAVDTYLYKDYKPVSVQQGDVIAVTWAKKPPLFLTEPIDCKGLLAEECFRRLLVFCLLAKDQSVTFLAVVSRPAPSTEGGLCLHS